MMNFMANGKLGFKYDGTKIPFLTKPCQGITP